MRPPAAPIGAGMADGVSVGVGGIMSGGQPSVGPCWAPLQPLWHVSYCGEAAVDLRREVTAETCC